MEQPATHPTPDMPAGIAAFLRMVRVLLAYGRRLDATLPQHIDHPRFPTFAAGFGTHDLGRILAHVQRGILRALMLERYLLARARIGREIEPVAPPAPAEQTEIETLNLVLRAPTAAKPHAKTIDCDDPRHFAIPTLRELEAQIRRRSVGRTIADICLDLGVSPSACDSGFWQDIFQALCHFGGNVAEVAATQQRRRTTFQHERDARPETWTWQIWDRPRDAIRQMLGFLLGEPPPQQLAAA